MNSSPWKGWLALFYLKLDGKVVLEKGFGMANPSLEIPNSPNTFFGVGSRPIDFTRAAIHLLEQQGKIDQDDTIDQYFTNVPPDKQQMTIRHLISGQSGLPDFFDTQEDWDPDLAWIDRETAEQRLLSQNLLFKPGADRWHGAWCFCAACGASGACEQHLLS
ncbi:MAG: serine hydrolase domain-containing protein [Balneolaceae bacterium]|nr:serine hydrolase domain-containing protein [Balneolaceae bacterium]